MAAFATPAQLSAGWRPLTTAEEAKAATLLEIASAKLRQKVPGLDARISSGAVDPILARSAVCDMVMRALRNPEGYRSEGDGDYNYTFSDSAVTAGAVKVTDDELTLFTAPQDVGSIRLRPALAPRCEGGRIW